MVERRAEVSDRLPDSVVQKRSAATDALMQLSGQKARLPFHPVRVLLPCNEEIRDIGLSHLKNVHRMASASSESNWRQIGIWGSKGCSCSIRVSFRTTHTTVICHIDSVLSILQDKKKSKQEVSNKGLKNPYV